MDTVKYKDVDMREYEQSWSKQAVSMFVRVVLYWIPPTLLVAGINLFTPFKTDNWPMLVCLLIVVCCVEIAIRTRDIKIVYPEDNKNG